jgi:hypothetical protein
MHVSVLPQEYNPRYKVPDELSRMRAKGVKLLDEDLNPSPYHERIICCHIKDMEEPTGDLVVESRDDEDVESTLTPFNFFREEAEQ